MLHFTSDRPLPYFLFDPLCVFCCTWLSWIFLRTHKHTLFGDVWTGYINCAHINAHTKTLSSRLNWTTMSIIPLTKWLQEWLYDLQITKRVALRITVRKLIFKCKVILNRMGSYRQHLGNISQHWRMLHHMNHRTFVSG